MAWGSSKGAGRRGELVPLPPPTVSSVELASEKLAPFLSIPSSSASALSSLPPSNLLALRSLRSIALDVARDILHSFWNSQVLSYYSTSFQSLLVDRVNCTTSILAHIPSPIHATNNHPRARNFASLPTTSTIFPC
jgi:hypothetical protein